MKKISKLTLLLALNSLLNASEEPQNLTILRDSYQRAQARALSPLQEKYISELQALKTQFTKNGKLEEALQVDAELKKILLDPTAEKNGKGQTNSSPDNLIGEWICNGIEGDVYLIKKNGIAYHAADKGAWKFADEMITINWENGFRLTIATSQTGDSVLARSYRPGSENYDTLEFTRKKAR